MFIPGMTGILSGAGQFASAPPPANDPWDDLVDLGLADGWQAMYDFNNPDTWTLRDAGGGSMFYSSIADSMGNFDPLVQATTGNQPPQVTQGGKYMGEFNGSRLLARSAGTTTTPRVIVNVLWANSTGNFRNFIGPFSSGNHFAQTGTYAYLISDNSTNQPTGNNVFTSGAVNVVTAIWAAGTNNSKIRVNGTQVLQTTFSSPPSLAGMRYGYGFTGRLGFCAIYQGSLTGSSDALSRMEDLLKTQLGI